MGKFLFYWVGLGLFVLLGLYARLEGIFAGTFGFTHDQGRDLLEAFAIAHGDLTLIGPTTGLSGVFHGPLWYWILAVFSFFGQGDPKFILASIVFLFIAVEFFLFFVILKYYGKLVGFIVLTLLSLSPFFMGLNGQLWSPSLILLSFMLTLCAVLGIMNGRRWFWLLGISLGFNIQFEAAGGFFILLAIIFTYLSLKTPKIKFKDLLISAAWFIFTLIPQIIFEIRHGFLMSKIFFGYLTVKKSDFIAEFGVKSVEYKTGLFFDTFYKIFFRDNLILTLGLILIIFLLCVKIEKFSQKSKIVIRWGFSMLFFLWIIMNLYFDVVWNHFVYSASILYIIIVAFVFNNARRYAAFLTYASLSFLILIMGLSTFNGLNKQKSIVGDHSYFRNQISIVDTIYNDAGNEPFNVVVYDPTTFSYTYDYLFKWYGNEKYGKLPVANETHVKLVYFIIEPDSIAGRREKWIKERDGEGNIIWESDHWKQKNKDVGLVLQKRIRDKLY